MRTRTRISAILAVVATVGIALWLVWLVGGAPDGEEAPRRDTIATAVDSAPLSSDTVAERDTLVRPLPIDSPQVAARTPGVPGPGPFVDSSIAAVERSIMARSLVIPVEGIRPDQLIDTYTASRSEARVHNAIDIMAPGGAAVLAVADGTVLKLFNSERGGITLYHLDPDGRTVYYYAHLAGYAAGIAEGQRLRRGQLIGYVGDTGNAGPGNTHLHFEITIVESPTRYWSGTPVNPYPILRRARS